MVCRRLYLGQGHRGSGWSEPGRHLRESPTPGGGWTPSCRALPPRPTGPTPSRRSGPGSYDVQLRQLRILPNGTPSNFVTQWYNNQPAQSSANAVAVTSGTTTDSINAAMVGRRLHLGHGDRGSRWSEPPASAQGPRRRTPAAARSPGATAADGTYTLSGLDPPSTYDVQLRRLRVLPERVSGNYVTQWWQNASSQFTATAVSVTTGGNHGGINAAMVAGGSISGTVTAAVGGANLRHLRESLQPRWLDADGRHHGGQRYLQLLGVDPGSYDVSFAAPTARGNAGNYATQWYNERPPSPRPTRWWSPRGTRVDQRGHGGRRLHLGQGHRARRAGPTWPASA